jgi:hypothetical protein
MRRIIYRDFNTAAKADVANPNKTAERGGEYDEIQSGKLGSNR